MTDKVCFVIAPFGEPGSDRRRRADQILKYVIAPALRKCGYSAVRADQISEPGLITAHVIQHILEDPLVIADLTDQNPNVYYELAIRHAIRKPFVQLIRTGEQIPFDVAGTRTIRVDHQDLESVEEARNEITRQVKSLDDDSSSLETPISVSLDLQLLRQSEDPKERSFADLRSELAEIRRSVSSLENRMTKQAPIPVTLVNELLAAARRLGMMIDELYTFEELKQFAHGGEIGGFFSKIREASFRLRFLVDRLAEATHH